MQIIAHRGASGQAPENTLAAFNRAWELGAQGIELDVHITDDGIPVCIHDPEVSKLCGKSYLVEQMTLAELKALDAGAWKDPLYAGERVPTLEEALATVPERRSVLIEIKDVPVRSIVPAMTPLLTKLGTFLETRQVTFMSFFPDLLWSLQSAFPELTQLLLVDKLSRLPLTIPKKLPHDTLPAHGIGFSHKLDIPAEKLDALNGAGAILAVWTENDPARAPYWQERGFDY
ncbi:MAG: glycerophosphodiester phosphodiesterase family protein, partial [Verrucomicrobiota bacterium]